MKVMEIEGVGETYATKLQDAGVATDADLLGRGATRKGARRSSRTSTPRTSTWRSRRS